MIKFKKGKQGTGNSKQIGLATQRGVHFRISLPSEAVRIDLPAFRGDSGGVGSIPTPESEILKCTPSAQACSINFFS